MIPFMSNLFSWLPAELQTICLGVLIIFFIVTILRIVRFILDLLPFL